MFGANHNLERFRVSRGQGFQRGLQLLEGIKTNTNDLTTGSGCQRGYEGVQLLPEGVYAA